LHTILPKQTIATLSQSPRLSKTISIDEKQASPVSAQVKRTKLDSTSSDSGLVTDSDAESQVKRLKLEQIDESSPKTADDNSTAD
jgi:hypothetical protein